MDDQMDIRETIFQHFRYASRGPDKKPGMPVGQCRVLAGCIGSLFGGYFRDVMFAVMPGVVFAVMFAMIFGVVFAMMSAVAFSGVMTCPVPGCIRCRRDSLWISAQFGGMPFDCGSPRRVGAAGYAS